jgi:hypothetical protein
MMLRPMYARNAGEGSTRESAAEPDSSSGEKQKNSSECGTAIVHWNLQVKPVAAAPSVAQNRLAKGHHEMTPILAILFLLVCIAVDAMLSGSEKSAKEELKISNHTHKA